MDMNQILENLARMTKPSSIKESSGYECEACCDFGYLWKLNEFPKECGCNLKKMNDVYLERSSELFAEEYKDFTLKSFIAKEQFQKYMLSAANNFLTKTGVFSILFLGQSGVGKSHICIAIANELIKTGAYV